MTLDRVDCKRSVSSSPSGSSSFLHGVKKAVILLCPGDDQSTKATGPGRAVRVQFATTAVDTGAVALQQRDLSVDTDR